MHTPSNLEKGTPLHAPAQQADASWQVGVRHQSGPRLVENPPSLERQALRVQDHQSLRDQRDYVLEELIGIVRRPVLLNRDALPGRKRFFLAKKPYGGETGSDSHGRVIGHNRPSELRDDQSTIVSSGTHDESLSISPA